MVKKKNKVLRFNPNGLQTKDRTNNTIKKLLNKKTSNIRELLEQKETIEENIKQYLENKQYTVYLCKISIPLKISIIISPKLLKPDLTQFKYDYDLNDYELEIETSPHLGQYYFR